MDLEEAKKLLFDEKKERSEKCQKEISEIAAKYNCRLDVTITVTALDIGK